MKDRINIAHLIYSPKIGGSEMVAIEICANLDNSKYNPIILCLFNGKGPVPEILKEKGITVCKLGFSPFTKLFWPFLPVPLLRRLKIDILHVHHISFLKIIYSAARLAGIKRIVLTEHTKEEISNSAKMQKISPVICKKADRITVVSKDLKNYLDQLLGLPSDSIEVIYNGIDITRFSMKRDKSALLSIAPKTKETPVICTVARLEDQKDYPNALQAMKLLKDKGIKFHYIVIGTGTLAGNLENLAKSLDISDVVTFLGRRTDINKLLPGIDVFVLPSWYEGFPVSLLEAMASGVPVVATNVNGVPELIQDGVNGLLAPSRNANELALAIEKILGDKQLAFRLAQQARKTVEDHFLLPGILKQYLSIYSDLLKKKGASDFQVAKLSAFWH